jgi:hypothetical protein
MLAETEAQMDAGQVGLNAGILPSPGLTYVKHGYQVLTRKLQRLRGKAILVTGT